MHVAQNWRLRDIRYKLAAVRCATCGSVILPSRTLCPHCDATTQPTHYTFDSAPLSDKSAISIGDGMAFGAFDNRQAAR